MSDTAAATLIPSPQTAPPPSLVPARLPPMPYNVRAIVLLNINAIAQIRASRQTISAISLKKISPRRISPQPQRKQQNLKRS